MKKILALFIAMAITAALWAGGTAVYASIYTVSAPNLTVTLDNGEAFKEAVVFSSGINWEPGYTSYKNIKINCDTQFNWQMTFTEPADSTTAPYQLSDVIEVYWSYTDEIVGMTRTAAIGNMTYVGTLKDVLAGTKTISGNVGSPANGSETITVALKMRESADNHYQGLQQEFSTTVRVDAVTDGAAATESSESQ